MLPYQDAISLFKRFTHVTSEMRPTTVQVERWAELALQQGVTNFIVQEAKETLLAIKYYCLGFAFYGEKVLLILKDHPEWQAGKYNGLGGELKEGERFDYAMIREFEEECGIKSTETDWRHAVTITSSQHVMRVFASHSLYIEDAQTLTPEPVAQVSYSRLATSPLVPNLGWLVPLCTDLSVRGPIEIQLRK